MKAKNKRSMFYQFLTPLTLFIIFQTIIYLVVFLFGGVFTVLKQNYYDIFNQRVSARNLFARNEMLEKWSNLYSCEQMMVEIIEQVAEEQGKSVYEIKHDYVMNSQIISRATETLINTLRKNGTTGIYFMLDGMGVKDQANTRAGVYIKNYDPTQSDYHNNDLLLMRGLPSLATEQNIALDSNWKSSFLIEENGRPKLEFLYDVIAATRSTPDKITNVSNYGKWQVAKGTHLREDEEVLSYTIPVVLPDGTVAGVLGIDIEWSLLVTLLNHSEIQQNASNAYFLGYSSDGGKTYQKVYSSGALYDMYFKGAKEIVSEGEIYPGVCTFRKGHNGRETIVGSVQPLNLYDNNTPFEEEKWALIGLTQKQNLDYFSDYTAYLIGCVSLINLVIGVVLILLLSGALTRPIKKLIAELEESDTSKRITLPRLNVKEIDTLALAVENMSQSVAESASRVYKIIKMTQVPIGVFELETTAKDVFCSASLFSIMGWQGNEGKDCSIPLSEFNTLLMAAFRKEYEEDRNIYEIDGENGARRWIQVTTQVDSGVVLGTVLEVTQDIEHKIRLEQERDYDSLTGLFNRRAFEYRLGELFEQKQKILHTAAIMMIDLDNLKYLNDTYGHDTGDRYIQQMGRAICCIQNHNHVIVARRSGDEFYLLLYNFESKQAVRETIDKMWKNITSSSVDLPDGEKQLIRASGGIAWYGDDADNFRDLIHCADTAMYYVKHRGKGSYVEYDPDIHPTLQSQLIQSNSANLLSPQSMLMYQKAKDTLSLSE